MNFLREALKLTACMTFFLQGCIMVGPDYQKPEAPATCRVDWAGQLASHATTRRSNRVVENL